MGSKTQIVGFSQTRPTTLSGFFQFILPSIVQFIGGGVENPNRGVLPNPTNNPFRLFPIHLTQHRTIYWGRRRKPNSWGSQTRPTTLSGFFQFILPSIVQFIGGGVENPIRGVPKPDQQPFPAFSNSFYPASYNLLGAA